MLSVIYWDVRARNAVIGQADRRARCARSPGHSAFIDAALAVHPPLEIDDPGMSWEPGQQVMRGQRQDVAALRAPDPENVGGFEVPDPDLELQPDLARLVGHGWNTGSRESVLARNVRGLHVGGPTFQAAPVKLTSSSTGPSFPSRDQHSAATPATSATWERGVAADVAEVADVARSVPRGGRDMDAHERADAGGRQARCLVTPGLMINCAYGRSPG